MIKKLITYFYVLLIFFIFISCTAKNSDSIQIVLVSSTDTHGSFFPTDHLTNKNHDHSLAHLSFFLKELRKNPLNRVIYFDLGDYYQGDPIADYFNTKTQNPNIASSILNYLEPTCFVIGNHEFDYGAPLYNSLKKDLSCPVLSANIIDKTTKQTFFTPYIICEIEGIRIAILGMTTPSISLLPKHLRENLYFEDIIKSAEKWITIIKNTENPDLIVGAFHSGFGSHQAGNKSANTSISVAEQVEGFDIIFKGHDHLEGLKKIISPSGKTVLVLGGASSVKSVVQVTIPLKRLNKKWKLRKFDAKIIKFAKEKRPVDREFLSIFETEWTKGQQFLNQIIGELSEPISSKKFLFGPCPFVDLIHKIQYDIAKNEFNTEADISITGVGKLIDIDKKVRIRDLYRMYYYENWPALIELTGLEIKNLIEFFLTGWFNTMSSEDSYLLDYVLNKNGELIQNNRGGIWELKKPTIHFAQFAGINFSVDLEKKSGNRVQIKSLSKDKATFDIKKKYKVISNEFLINSMKHHALISKTSSGKTVYKDTRSLIKKYIEKQGFVTVPHYNNWELLPKAWVDKARIREYELWFPNN